jgi:hypothetical protein
VSAASSQNRCVNCVNGWVHACNSDRVNNHLQPISRQLFAANPASVICSQTTFAANLTCDCARVGGVYVARTAGRHRLRRR